MKREASENTFNVQVKSLYKCTVIQHEQILIWKLWMVHSATFFMQERLKSRWPISQHPCQPVDGAFIKHTNNHTAIFHVGFVMNYLQYLISFSFLSFRDAGD